MPDVFSAADARHWALLTRAALAARRTEIDDLNVFPVPDGDTGTNLYLTFDAAIDDVVAAHEEAGRLGGATLVDRHEIELRLPYSYPDRPPEVKTGPDPGLKT